MKNECSKIHLPNYKSTCCIRHLVEMSKYADMQMLNKKYAKLLLEILNHNYKLNYIQYSKMKLDLFLRITDVITKYISHFFLINRLDYAILLGKICILGFKETAFKDHPEVISRQIAIINNISCIYEAKGKLNKAFYYLNKNREFICVSTNIDNAILYNNLIRICYQLNNKDILKILLKEFNDAIEEEVRNAKVNSIKKTFDLSSTLSLGNIVLTQTELTAKNQTLSFLYFNLGIALEKYGKCSEGKEAFIKGYEFSMSVLGEHHFYTHKFRTRLNLNVFLNKKDEGLNCYPKTHQALNKTYNIEKIKMYNKPKSFSIDKSQYHYHNSHSHSHSKNKRIDDEYKQKLDIIYDFIINQNEIQEARKIQSETEPSSSHIKHFMRDNKAYDRLKTVLKPFLNKCIIQNKNFNALKPTTITQKALIDEVLREFQNEVDMNKKSNAINKQGSSSETAVSIKTIKTPINGKADGKLKKEIELKNTSSNENNSQSISNSIELNTMSLNSKFTFKDQTSDEKRTENEGREKINRRNKDDCSIGNDIKLNNKLHVDSINNGLNASNNNNDTVVVKNKAIVPILSVTLNNEDMPTEMNPFYISYKGQKKTMKSIAVYQKNVKFLRQNDSNSNKKPSFIQDCLKGATLLNNRSQGFPQQSLDNSINNTQESFKVINYNYNVNSSQYLNETNSLEIGIMPLTSVNILNIFNLDYIDKEEELASSESALQYKTDYMSTKLKSKDNQINLFDKLIKQSALTLSTSLSPLASSYSSFCISTLLLFQNNYMKIIITQKTINAPIVFKLLDSKDNNNASKVLSEITIDLSKLKQILQHVNLYKTLPRYMDLNQLNSIEDLIQKVLIYHCNIIKNDTKYTTGISPKPNGLCGDKQMSFKFLKTYCTMDLLVIDNRILRIIITYLKNLGIFLIIDCYCDESSFNDILSPVQNQVPIGSNEIFVPVYKFNGKQMEKNGLMRLILKRTQDIIKYKANSQEITFTSLQRDLKDYFIQCTIKDHCTNVNYIDIELNKNASPSTGTGTATNGCYMINYWHSGIGNEEDESNMAHSSFIIDSHILNSLFNININSSEVEFRDTLKLLNEREKSITQYLLLNSFDYDNDNDDCLKVIKPVVLFNYTTLVYNEYHALINFNIAQYAKEHYIAKIIYYNRYNNYEYSIIFVPSQQKPLEHVIATISSNKAKLSALVNEVYKEYIEKVNIPIVKYLPITFLTNKFN